MELKIVRFSKWQVVEQVIGRKPSLFLDFNKLRRCTARADGAKARKCLNDFSDDVRGVKHIPN